MTPTQFRAWGKHAVAGERVTYFTGLLMYSRWLTPATLDANIEQLRLSVMEASERGLVALTQRRVSPGVCDYIATRL